CNGIPLFDKPGPCPVFPLKPVSPRLRHPTASGHRSLRPSNPSRTPRKSPPLPPVRARKAKDLRSLQHPHPPSPPRSFFAILAVVSRSPGDRHLPRKGEPRPHRLRSPPKQK